MSRLEEEGGEGRSPAPSVPWEAQRFLQATLDALIPPLAILDQEGKIETVNRSWRQFAEESGGSLLVGGVGDNYLDVCTQAGGSWAADAPLVAQGIREVAAGKRHEFGLEYPCHSPKEQRWFSVRVTRLDWEEPMRVVVAHENISARKRAEEELRWKTAFLEAQVQSSIDGILVVDGQGKKVLQNEQIARLFQIPRDIFEEEDDARQVQWVANRVKDPEQFAQKVVHLYSNPNEISHEEIDLKDGTVLERYSSPVLGNDGVYYGRIWTFHDITQRKRAEKIVTFQAHLLNEVGQAVIATDREGTVLYWNRYAEALYGWSPEEARGREINSLIVPELGLGQSDDIREQLNRGERWSGEFMVEHRDGTIFPAAVTHTPIYDEAGTFSGIISISKDITERKQTEQALRENEERFRFLHDLTEATRPLSKPEQVMEVTARMLGEHLRVSRCAYADVAQDGEQFIILHDYTDGCTSTVGQYQLSFFGARAVTTLHRGETLIIRNVEAELLPGEGADMFNALGIKAIITCPLVKEGSLRAMMAVHQTTPRDWQQSEITLVQSLVERCWASIERRRAEEALQRAHNELETRVEERTASLTQTNAEMEAEIAERRRAEAEVQRSRQELQSFLDAMSTLAAKLAPDGTFLFANQVAFDASGLSPEEYMKTNFLEGPWWTFDPAVQTRVRAMFGKACSGTPVNYDEDIFVFGQNRTINFSLIPLRDAEGKVESLIAEGRDITKLKHTEAALQQAKAEAERANRAKSEFLSRMSHELRTPLNAILGFGQILEKQPLTPLQEESVGYILKGGHHLLDLINEILDIARVEAGRVPLSIEPTALGAIVPEACELIRPLAAQRGIGLDISLPATGWSYVMADRQRLKQVLLNLLSNAIKYNHPGGQVEVSCPEAPKDRIRIAVRDTGPGISAEHLPRLFTPFERLAAAESDIEGTGLGLALSQRLILAMGGTLDVQSVKGEGSTFFIELPRAQDPRAGQETRSNRPEDAGMPASPQGLYTVLNIEDNTSNLRLLEVILSNRPEIRLLAAMQGSIGLDIARQQTPDLILLDMHLPDIPGSEVLARLQQSPLTKDIPVVVVSADATPLQIEQLLDAGVRAYLTKPLDIDEFLRTMDILLRQKGASPPSADSAGASL